MPGQIDRYNMRRLVSMTANIEGEDLGRVAARLAIALNSCREGSSTAFKMDLRGQIGPMNDLFRSLGFGLAGAVGAITLLLWRVSIVAIGIGCGGGGSGRAGRCCVGSARDRHNAESPVVHRGDHGGRCGGC
jgi:hypothetical protein